MNRNVMKYVQAVTTLTVCATEDVSEGGRETIVKNVSVLFQSTTGLYRRISSLTCAMNIR